MALMHIGDPVLPLVIVWLLLSCLSLVVLLGVHVYEQRSDSDGRDDKGRGSDSRTARR